MAILRTSSSPRLAVCVDGCQTVASRVYNGSRSHRKADDTWRCNVCSTVWVTVGRKKNQDYFTWRQTSDREQRRHDLVRGLEDGSYVPVLKRFWQLIK